MIAHRFQRLSLVMTALVVFGTQSAVAACVIGGVRPTVPLPTMESGQDFVFLATDDCETLRFRVPGTRFIKTPRPGPDTGSKDRTYKVVLTESEWNSLVDERDTTFTWSIVGTTSTGVTTRVTTTNELKVHVTIDLAMAEAKLVGDSASSVSGAGDVDGDGHDDLLVGSEGNAEGGSGAGAAYLVLGPVTGTLDLALADAMLVGEEAYDYAGAVSGAGDVDGDGHDDVLVGAPGSDAGGVDAGCAYLVLGPVTGPLDLSLADTKLVGEHAGDQAAESVSGAGDVDGDGHDDLLVGAYLDDEGGSDAGAAYLVLGPITGTRDLSLANAKFVGEGAGDNTGYLSGISSAGDVDGDGHDDVLVGAVYNDERGHDAGAAYLVLGPVTGTLDLSLADAQLVGEDSNGYAGLSVSGAGDVDGDGHVDLLVTATGVGGWAGAAYLVLGPASGTSDLRRADAKLVGEESEDFAGISVSDAGDVDGDGRDDVLVGAYANDRVGPRGGGRGNGAGAAYLVLGPVTGTLDLALADAKLVGQARGFGAGWSVSGAGDVDGDGHKDVLVGSWRPGAYLVYGGGLF